MPTEVIFPRVDMDMTSGQISRWYFKDGDKVEKGKPLFEIETDKAAMEIDAEISGILRAPAASGASIDVGAVVGWIVAEGQDFVPPVTTPRAAQNVEPAIANATTVGIQQAVAPQPNIVSSSNTNDASTEGEWFGVRATPFARMLAKSNGIAVEDISGSGPHGRIQADDVTNYAKYKHPAPSRHGSFPQATKLVASSGPLHTAYLREGSGEPIVMIHGFGADLNSWRPLVQAMGHGRTIVAVDLPGHGQSPWQGASSIGAVVQSVKDAIDGLGLVDIHLVGHSLGAAIATLAIKGLKTQVKSLFLVSPAGLGPEINEGFINGFCRASNEVSLRAWMDQLVEDPQVLTDAFVRLTAQSRATGQVAAAQRALADLAFIDGAQSVSIRQTLSGLMIPSRIVMGLSDKIIPARHVEDIPAATALHRLKNVGHMPHVEARELLARLIQDHSR
jgi:pimeloyl-ACP methyl ester carboxylesterase